MMRKETRSNKTIGLCLPVVICFCFAVNVVGQNKGFTNKTEAKNERKDSLKEGKWIEYVKENGTITTDTGAPYYSLAVYKDGRASGIMRRYTKSGILFGEISMDNGKKNGVTKWYYLNGTLKSEVPYTDDKKNGVAKVYDDKGKLGVEIPYDNGIEDGMEKS